MTLVADALVAGQTLPNIQTLSLHLLHATFRSSAVPSLLQAAVSFHHKVEAGRIYIYISPARMAGESLFGLDARARSRRRRRREEKTGPHMQGSCSQ